MHPDLLTDTGTWLVGSCFPRGFYLFAISQFVIQSICFVQPLSGNIQKLPLELFLQNQEENGLRGTA